MNKLIGILAFLMSLNAFGVLSQADQAQFRPGSLGVFLNPGFEQGDLRWTETGSSVFTMETSDVWRGVNAGSWDASATTEVLAGNLVTVPKFLQGQKCVAQLFYKGGDANLTMQIVDSVPNVLASKVLAVAAGWTEIFVPFTCPASGTFGPRILASANAAAVLLDDFNVYADSMNTIITSSTLDKTLIDTYLDMNEESAPATPSSGKLRVYAGTDKKVHTIDSNGIDSVVGSGSGGSFNYVTNPGATDSGTTGVVVAGSGFTVTRATNIAIFSDSYFKLTGNTTINKTVDWELGDLQDKHDQQLIHFKANIKLDLDTGSVGVYKIGVYNNTDAAYVAGTEATLVDGALLPWGSLFILDSSKEYFVRVQATTAGNTLDAIYVDDISISPEGTIAATAKSPWQSFTPTLTASGGGSVSIGSAGSALAQGFYKQDDQDMVGRAIFRWGTSSPSFGTSGLYRFTIPGSKTINTTLLSSGSTSLLGQGKVFDSDTSDSFPLDIEYNNSDANIIFNISTSLAGASLGPTTPFTVAASDFIVWDFRIPIAEWAGAGITMANSQVEYAYNSSGITAAGASDTTAFAYGPGGAAVGAINSTTGTSSLTTMRVRFTTPIQSTDRINLQFAFTPKGPWQDAQDTFYSGNAQGASFYGAGWIRVGGSSTDVTVRFGNKGAYSSNATYAGDGATWTGESSLRWRMQKSSNPIGIGTGLATSEQPGAVDYYKTSLESLTFTFNGSGGNDTENTRFTRVGKMVTVHLGLYQATTGTSSTTLTCTACAPTWARPTSTIVVQGATIRNSGGADTTANGVVQIGSNGDIIIFRNYASLAWANAASGGLQNQFPFSYGVD